MSRHERALARAPVSRRLSWSQAARRSRADCVEQLCVMHVMPRRCFWRQIFVAKSVSFSSPPVPMLCRGVKTPAARSACSVSVRPYPRLDVSLRVRGVSVPPSIASRGQVKNLRAFGSEIMKWYHRGRYSTDIHFQMHSFDRSGLGILQLSAGRTQLGGDVRGAQAPDEDLATHRELRHLRFEL